MATYNPEAPVLDTYQAVVSAYCDFLTVAIHTILYERNIYPQTSFLKARKYNYPVRQSRHPKVCKWIQDAVAAVEGEMLKCTIAQTSLIIHAPPPSSLPLERYVFSTASFPRIPLSETRTPFAPTSTTTTTNNPNPPTTTSLPQTSPPIDPQTSPPPPHKLPLPPPPPSDLPEQFRATFSRLSTRLTDLQPLPSDCSFTLAIELRDEEGVEVPIEREGRWVVAEPGLQKPEQGSHSRGGKRGGGNGDGDGDGDVEMGGSKRGRDLGGVRTTPVRSLEAGAFRMEVWVEEGRGKFQAKVEDEWEDGEGEGDGDGEGR